MTLPLFRNRDVHAYLKRINLGSEFHLQLRVIGRVMSSICQANEPRPPPQQPRSSPRSALQRPLAKSHQSPLDLLFAPSHSSLDQYLADIPPPLRTQKSANSFSSKRDGGDSREAAHQQSHGEQFLQPGTAIDSSTSSDGKFNDSESVDMAYQQGRAPDWIFPPPTNLEPKTYRAGASDIMLARPRLKHLQPHAASDVELTRIQQLDLEGEDTPWLPIQKPELESSLVTGPKSAEWHAKDYEYSVLTPSTALPTPQKNLPSPKSETHPDNDYPAYQPGRTSLNDYPVPSPPMYGKSHDMSFYLSSNCHREEVYYGPDKHLGAGINEAKVTQLGGKQSEEQIARVFPTAFSGSSTAKCSSRVNSQEGQGPMSPPYGPGNMYENLLNLTPNSGLTDSNNPFLDSDLEFPTGRPTIPAKAKQLLGIHPESQPAAIKNLPLRPQTKPSNSFLSKLSNRKAGKYTMLTQDSPSVQTGKKSTSLGRIITAAFQPAGGKGITRSKLGR